MNSYRESPMGKSGRRWPDLKQILIASTLQLLCGVALAAGYPERPVTVIVSLPPGSGADTTARFISKHLTEKFKQTFVVENRPGANSFIAAKAVAEAPADGYTMFVASNSPMVTNAAVFRSLPYDAVKDFAPVARIGRFPMVLVVPANSPFKSLQDLISAARSQPGKLNFASGTATYQLALETLHERNGISAVSVPYKGTSAAINDVAGGSVDYSMAEVSAVMPLVQSGRIRPLAVATAARLQDLPDVPTVSESGTDNYESYAWTGAFFPAKVPPEIVSQVSQAILDVVNSEEGTRFLEGLGGEPFPAGPQEFRNFQISEIEKAEATARAANIQLE
jgi:tripartite-type tricarboxylate transporter receptor subunit TctC